MTAAPPALDPVWLALCYGGVFAAGAAALSRRLGAPDARRAGRAAWCAAWLAATLVWLLPTRPDGPAVDFSAAFTAAAWTAAAAAWVALARRQAASAQNLKRQDARTPEEKKDPGSGSELQLLPWRPGVLAFQIPWLIAVACVGAVGAYRRGFPIGLALAAAVALGGLVERAMQRAAWLRFRVVAYWTSFVGTFAALVPLALSARDATPRLLPLWAGAAIAILLVLAAVPLAVSATRAFAAAGGTPEPLDPPVRLCRTSVYAHLRHPIQLAEILFVAAGAAAIGTRAALAFLVLFAAALAGPIRVLEERALLARFGASAADYCHRCPRFVPTFSRRRLPDQSPTEASAPASGA
jgi:protein-S-isoprenylcysteine O-methyltransferase Ste14